jgi:trimethylamine:corrinoid methyltransferase-like protein
LDGSKSAEQVAHEKMKALLTSYKAPALDLEIEAAIKEYISNRKAEINS